MCTGLNISRGRFLSIFAMRNDSSNSFRFNVYHSSIEMFKDNPNVVITSVDELRGLKDE